MAEETPVFDAKAFMDARNAGKSTVVETPVATAEVETPVETTVVETPKEEKPDEPRIPRSARREMNRLREQMAEERGKRIALEESMRAKPAAVPAGEPQRDQYVSDAEYARALAKHYVQSEASTVQQQTAQTEALRQQIAEADAVAEEHRELFENWDDLVEEANDIPLDESQTNLVIWLRTSDVRSFVVEHLVNNPKDCEKLLSLAGNPVSQQRLFARIEGKCESVYNKRLEAAQAKKKSSEDRTTIAAGSGKDGSTVKPLPKPSQEVVAKGGTAGSFSDPVPGSKAWMQERNRKQFGR